MLNSLGVSRRNCAREPPIEVLMRSRSSHFAHYQNSSTIDHVGDANIRLFFEDEAPNISGKDAGSTNQQHVALRSYDHPNVSPDAALT